MKRCLAELFLGFDFSRHELLIFGLFVERECHLEAHCD